MVRLTSVFRYWLVLVLLGATLGCGSEAGSEAGAVEDLEGGAVGADVQTAISPPPSQQPVSQPSPKQQAARAPGRYCYSLDDGIVTTHLRLTIDSQHQLQGDARSTVQNEEAAYYTSYTQQFLGALTVDQAAVNLTTWVEYDVQKTNETWTLTDNSLQINNNKLSLTDCQLVDPIFQDQNGLEASDLLDSATTVHTQRVEFAPGKSSATVSNSVVRGDRDVYLLGANGGQQMQLSIESLEENAAFDVVSPSGHILTLEAVDETVFLQHTGDHQVIVGGTRGNASYELTIGIQ